MTGIETKQISESVKARFEWAEETLCAILKGKKPVIDRENVQQGWLFDQITRMRAGHFLSEVAKSYVTLPDETEQEIDLKGDTRFHSFGHALFRQVQPFRKALRRMGVKNFKVFGEDYGYRMPKTDPLRQVDDAGAFVLLPGDFHSLSQFIMFLQSPPKNKPLIIFNRDGFWDPVIQALDLQNDPRVKVAKTRRDVTNILRYMPNRKQEPVFSTRTLKIKAGATILEDTSNNKKIYELDDSLAAKGAILRVLPFRSIVGKPREADEISFTATGNNMEKTLAVRDLILRETIETIKKNLEDRGIDPAQTTVWMDDRAIEFAEDFFRTSLFDDCRHILNDYKPGPGAELANVLKIVPLRKMYERLQQAASLLMTENERLGNARDLDLSAEDIQVITVMPLIQDDYANLEYYCFHSMRENEVNFSPIDPNKANVYSEDFLSVKASNPDRLRNSELPDYYTNRSPLARCVETAAYVLDMNKHYAQMNARPGIAFNRAGLRKGKEWRASTVSGLTQSFNLSHGATCHTVPFNSIAVNDNDSNWIMQYGAHAKDVHAFLWTPEDEVTDTSSEEFWERMYTFFKISVDGQVFCPDAHGKPHVILHDKSETRSTCDAQMKVYKHLHDLGFIGDKPEHMFYETDSLDEALSYLERKFARYVPNRKQKSGKKEWGEANTDIYTVTVYASATNETPEVLDSARKLARCLAVLGFGAQTGGGDKSGMAAVSDGFHQAREWWQGKEEMYGAMPENYIAGIQCMDTYLSEGMYEGNDYSCVWPTMEERELHLRKSHSEVALPGGAGTIREVAASIVSRIKNLDSVQNKSMSIVNADFHGEKVYQPFVDLLVDDFRDKHNIQVSPNWEKTLIYLVQQRRAAGMEPDNLNWNVLKEPYFGLSQKTKERLVPVQPVRLLRAPKDPGPV